MHRLAIQYLLSSDLRDQREYSDALRQYFHEKAEERGYPFTYAIRTYGCQLNESDSEKLAGLLREMTFEPASTDDADIVIFNTCSVRENANDRLFGNLGVLKAAKRKNPSMMVAVCGCMMKQDENVERIRKSFGFVDLLFGPQDIHRIPEFIYSRIFREKKRYEVSETDFIVDDTDLPIQRERRFRALVPIMYGCNNFCTYCIVPYTRGRERSRPFEKIMEEVTELAAEGFKEILLLGQNVNSYGLDQPGSPDFGDILEAVSRVPGISRVRFMTSHPKDLSHRIIDIMADSPTIEKHLHLPLQSGSDKVLREMNRHYTREQFLETAMYFREKVPDGTITTDIIVGFPHESEDDFLDTLSVMEKVRFDAAFTFQYSPRPGTPAATMEGQIDKDVVTERFSRLLDMQNRHCFESGLSVVGSVEEVLIEGKSETADHILSGRTRSNRLVNFRLPDQTMLPDQTLLSDATTLYGDILEGALCYVKITGARPYSLEGILESFIYEQ